MSNLALSCQGCNGHKAELLRLTDEVEMREAERVEHLGELARRRGVSLGVLVEQLGLLRPGSGGAPAQNRA